MPRSERFSLPDALAQVAAETGVDFRSGGARVGIGRGHLLEIVVQCGEFAVADEPAALVACERLIELLLGGEIYHDWVGTIRSVPGPKARSLRMASAEADVFLPLQQLAAAIEAGCGGILAGLAERPYHTFCEHAAWTLLDVEPVLNDARVAQDDLVLCSTMLPEMMKSFLQKDPFSSCRFSRHGELFVYLKYADTDRRSSEERLAERAHLEDALNRALVPGAVGCVVGAGLGVRHAYIDLAMLQLEHGIALIREIWRRGGGAGPAWLQFCDSVRQREWIAVSDSASTPPGCDREAKGRPVARGLQVS